MFKAHKRLKRVPQTDFNKLTRRFWYTRLLLFKPKMSSYHVQERPSSHFFPSLLEIFASYTSHETTSTPFHRFQHNRAPSTLALIASNSLHVRIVSWMSLYVYLKLAKKVHQPGHVLIRAMETVW